MFFCSSVVPLMHFSAELSDSKSILRLFSNSPAADDGEEEPIENGGAADDGSVSSGILWVCFVSTERSTSWKKCKHNFCVELTVLPFYNYCSFDVIMIVVVD